MEPTTDTGSTTDSAAVAAARTRTNLQTIAEHLLAADLFHHTGRIGLRATPGGFGQPEFLVDGTRRRLRIDGTRLAMVRGDEEVWTDITTMADLARFCDVALGAPRTLFTPTTEFDPDADLLFDPRATAQLADFYALANTALEALRSHHSERSPAIVQLWPEHFDLATNMSEVNFGASAGDAAVPEPYFYVGPWTPRTGPFWNAPFGAVLTHDAVTAPDGLPDADEVIGFFTEDLRLATS